MEPLSLHILPDVEHLIPPHASRDLRKLEVSLLAEGCKSPIIVWNGIILDGHARYKICLRNKIPITIQNNTFLDLNQALSWVCNHQLTHRKLAPEMKKYLIGKQYECERALRATDSCGKRLYPFPQENTTAMMKRLAEEYGLSVTSIQRYGHYSRHIDTICAKTSGAASKYLSGGYDLPISDVAVLSHMPSAQLVKELKKRKNSHSKRIPQPQRLPKAVTPSDRQETPLPAIKNMPAFDPDAEITGLTLTIPSWISSIDRIINKTDLTIITPQARSRLEDALFRLQDKVSELRSAIREET